MILQIVAFGHPVLKKRAEDVQQGHLGLTDLVNNMWDTLYNADGLGLAAPQVNESVRVIVLDGDVVAKTYPEMKGFKRVLINPEITWTSEDTWVLGEGCLSIPDIYEEVERPVSIKIKYYDENFQLKQEEVTGMAARLTMHEIDHLEGTVFIDRLSGLKKMMLKGKLNNISKGDINVRYRMTFPFRKKR